MIKAIVADDEAVARRRIARLLREEGVTVVAECTGGVEAADRISSGGVDIVFLDVQMPDLTGIEVVERVGAERMPPVVFVTAHDEYAIRAFELNAVDYLLKPYDSDRFKQALERAKIRLTATDTDRRSADAVLLRSVLHQCHDTPRSLHVSPRPLEQEARSGGSAREKVAAGGGTHRPKSLIGAVRASRR